MVSERLPDAFRFHFGVNGSDGFSVMNTDTISPQLLAQLQAMRTQTTQAYQKGAEGRDVATPSREVRSQDAAVKIELSAEAQRMTRGLDAPQAVRPAQVAPTPQATNSVEFVSLVSEAMGVSETTRTSETAGTSQSVGNIRREAPFAHVRAAQQSDVPYQRPGSLIDISV